MSDLTSWPYQLLMLSTMVTTSQGEVTTLNL